MSIDGKNEKMMPTGTKKIAARIVPTHARRMKNQTTDAATVKKNVRR